MVLEEAVGRRAGLQGTHKILMCLNWGGDGELEGREVLN